MKPITHSQAGVIKSWLLCSVVGFLFSGFSWGEFWESVGVFFYDGCDWGFESWWNYNNALCVFKTALMSFVRLILHTAEYITSFSLMSLGFALWEKWFSAVRNVYATDVIGRSKASFSKNKKKKKICCVQLLISHQTESASIRSVSQGIRS